MTANLGSDCQHNVQTVTKTLDALFIFKIEQTKPIIDSKEFKIVKFFVFFVFLNPTWVGVIKLFLSLTNKLERLLFANFFSQV